MGKTAIIGLGYVGLCLALQAKKKGLDVIGIEKNQAKVDLINAGTSPIKESFAEDLLSKGVRIEASTDYAAAKSATRYIVCVPTPVTEDTKQPEPDYSYVKNAVRDIAPFLNQGDTIIIESTVNPGTCEEVVSPTLQQKLGPISNYLIVGKDIGILHCPERVDPGNKKYDVSTIPRNIGANHDRWLEEAIQWYNKITSGSIHARKGLWEAEFSKMEENCFRYRGIAAANENAKFADIHQKDITDVIAGADTKPFGYKAFWPSCGVGGHCIPVDPHYLLSYGRQSGFEFNGLVWAHDVNSSMPAYTLHRLNQALATAGMLDGGKNSLPPNLKVAILGLAYKPDIDDARMSPAIPIFHSLRGKGIDISVFDPYIDEHNKVNEQYHVHSMKDALLGADAVILTTAHSEFLMGNGGIELLHQMKRAGVKVITDGQNRLDMDTCRKLGITYRGIGRGVYD